MGETINLVNNFKVEKVIFNCGPYNDLEKELIKVLDKKRIKYYSCIKELNIDKNKLYFLQTKEYDNENDNDNSNVIYTELNGYKFKFMGDASTTTEKEILNKYNLLDIDALKVGHHGSKTSSSEEFIDEETPHIHCVVVPLVKKLDNRIKTERYTISKKQYIRDKIHLSRLQDMYHKRLTEKGYDLERGIKGSDNQHIKIKEYKKLTKKLNQELNVRNDRIDKAMADFKEKMKTTKQTLIIDKDFVKVKKETFDSMNNVIKESKKVMELQPKLQTIFNEVDSYANSYKSLEKENQKNKKEISKLEYENQNLEQENRSLIYRLNELFQLLKKILRKLLQRGNNYTKDEIAEIVKDCYDNSEFDMGDVERISKGTTKQDELFDYVDAPYYYKERVKDYNEYNYDKDDFDLGR